MSDVLDHLDDIEAAVPQLRGRMYRTKVAVAGHSMGGHTASVLLGTRLVDPQDGTEVDPTFGAGHGLGGISGYDAAETSDEDPARVAAVAWLTGAYLMTELGLDPDAWSAAQQALAAAPTPLGQIESSSNQLEL